VNKQKLKESFGVVIYRLRKKKKVSQQEVADNANFERRFITDLENGKKQPTITTIFKLAEYFEIPPGDILNEMSTLLKKTKK